MSNLKERMEAAGKKTNPKIMNSNIKPKLDVHNLKSPISGKQMSVSKKKK